MSDIAANVLKAYLTGYTRRQCELWKIPLATGLPIAHYFDVSSGDWSEGYLDPPWNPGTGTPLLHVPRRIVRLLPWINYEDYLRSDFAIFLTPRMPGGKGKRKRERREPPKTEVVKLTRDRLAVLDRYIDRREREGSRAEPALGPDLVSFAAAHRRQVERRSVVNARPRERLLAHLRDC